MPPSRSAAASSTLRPPRFAAVRSPLPPPPASHPRATWLLVAAVLVVAGAALWLHGEGRISLGGPERNTAVVNASGATNPSSSLDPAGNPGALPVAPVAAAAPLLPAHDLKTIFDNHISSGDPRERRHAVRAFEACVPVFLPAAGQAPSAQAYIDALPAGQRGDRQGAYRALFERCRRLLDQGSAWLSSTARALQFDPEHREPGLRTQEALLAGDYDRVAPLFAQALAGADADDVASLSGIALKIMRLRNPEGMEDADYRRAVAVDTALSLLACDLGRDCSAQSLWSLQLCVGEGLCPPEGHPAWLMKRMARQAKDEPEGVEQQRQRLLGLIRSGHALQTTDILPR